MIAEPAHCANCNLAAVWHGEGGRCEGCGAEIVYGPPRGAESAVEVTVGGQPFGTWNGALGDAEPPPGYERREDGAIVKVREPSAEKRDERPVTLPRWVVEYLVENAFGQYTVAEALCGGAHGKEELEAAWIIRGALDG